MDRRVLLGLCLLVLLISIKSTTTKADDDERDPRGILLNTLTTGSKFITLFQNYTASKLLKSASLLTSILNTTGTSLFKTKKIAVLTSLANATADLIAVKGNFTNLKLLKKLTLLSNSTTLGLKSWYNTSTTFLNNLLTAKLALTNTTLAAKLQFANASAIALQTAIVAKANKTETKLALFGLFNSTTFSALLAEKIAKKNISLFLSDELADDFLSYYNLTALENELLLEKFNKTLFLKNNNEDQVDYQDQDRNEYQVDYQFEYE